MQKNTVSGKLIAATCVAIAIVLTVYTSVSAVSIKSKTEQEILDLAVEKAAAVGLKVAGDITDATSAGTALAATLSGFFESGPQNRTQVIEIIKAIAPQYPTIFGAWMCELPNESVYKPTTGKIGANDEGVFTPYWTKTGNGDLEFSTWPVDTANEYFTVPLKSGKSTITAPYLTTVNKLVTSVSVPVRVGGEIVGLAGVDITLDELTSALNLMRPFEGGRVMLLANNGQWLAHPDKTQLMKAYADYGVDEVKRALDEKHVKIISNMPDGGVRVIYPFTAPGMNTAWAAVLDVPGMAFSAPVWRELYRTVFTGMILLVVTVAVIWLASRTFVGRPLEELLEAVTKMARGDYAEAIQPVKGRDELGSLSVALEKFRIDLADGRESKLEQETLRERVDADQRRQSSIDHSKAEELRGFVYVVQEALQRLASGDLTVRMNDDVSQEFDPIRVNFNHAVTALEDTVCSVINSVHIIRSGLVEISSASSDLAGRTERQASSLEETVAALGEVTRRVRDTADGSNAVKRTVDSAKADAEGGGEVVSRAIAAMTEIQGSSSRIENIIGVIDDIAFQTNLLALNAGVEAARAGEAGKGFAVVAQEVRELAQRSAHAAKEIKALISSATLSVEAGVRLVGESGASLDRIAGQVIAISDTVNEIAAGAQEQAVSLREVSAAANQMDQVTQQNAAMVEQTTAAAASLATDTDLLAHMVSVFIVTQSSAPSTRLAADARIEARHMRRTA